MRMFCWPCLPEQYSGCLGLYDWCDYAMFVTATAECMNCAAMPSPLTKPGCIGSQKQHCQRSLLAIEVMCPQVQELHRCEGTHALL